MSVGFGLGATSLLLCGHPCAVPPVRWEKVGSLPNLFPPVKEKRILPFYSFLQKVKNLTVGGT